MLKYAQIMISGSFRNGNHPVVYNRGSIKALETFDTIAFSGPKGINHKPHIRKDLIRR